ncbi:MAG: HAMP domain-containing protein [Proteobacteria bacterium]|nr:HAMP domain-containing protein [Pseudomonadota bacterium]
MKSSLNTKLIFSIGIVLIITTSFLGFTAIQLQRKQLSDQINNQGIFVSEVIQRSMWKAMLQCKIPAIQRTVDEIAKHHEIYRITLYSSSGEVFASSQPKDIGKKADKLDKSCIACHGDHRNPPSLPYKLTRIFSLNDKDQYLGVVAPIYNEPSCYKCHDSQITVLGILDVIFSLEKVKKGLKQFQQKIIGYGIITFAIISCLVYLLLRYLVSKPVKALAEATQKIGEGDYDYQVLVKSQDELGMLSLSFNKMVKDLKKSKDKISRWNQDLEKKINEATSQCEIANRELREANFSCEIANRSLKKYDNLRSRYVRIVAHELRAPLSNIASSLDILLKGYLGEITNQQTDMIKIAKKNASSLLDLINDLLNIGRAEQGEIEKKMREVFLEDIIKEAVDFVSSKAAEKNLSLQVDIFPSSPLKVNVDKKSIGHLLTNLIDNAVKYTPEGGTITVKVEEQGDEFLVNIIDTGIGIPEKDLPNVFDEFYRAGNAYNIDREGTGLGLSLAKKIVEIHGGEIGVTSKEGKGTTFYFSLKRL